MSKFEEMLIQSGLTREQVKALYVAHREEIREAELLGERHMKSNILGRWEWMLEILANSNEFGDDEREFFNIVINYRGFFREILDYIRNA